MNIYYFGIICYFIFNLTVVIAFFFDVENGFATIYRERKSFAFLAMLAALLFGMFILVAFFPYAIYERFQKVLKALSEGKG